MKKKKKKSKKEGDDDFAAKLAALDIDKEDAEEGETVQDGDMKAGTGIWSHDDTTPIKYDLLLVSVLLRPELLGSVLT